MNLLIGTLVLFSAIFLMFFGVPITGLFLMSMIGPASLAPIGKPIFADPVSFEELPQQDPICIQKVAHKGNYIWVDATPVFAAD